MDALTFGRLRNFGRLDGLLLLLSIGSSAAYMATRGVQPFPGSVLLVVDRSRPVRRLGARLRLRDHGDDRIDDSRGLFEALRVDRQYGIAIGFLREKAGDDRSPALSD